MRWRLIPGFHGYEASDNGHVRSIDRVLADGRKRKGVMLTPHVNSKNNRRYVSLGRATKQPVAVFVAMAFLGYSPAGYDKVVDHINNDCTDDRLSNLRIISQRKNIAEGYRIRGKSSGLPTGVSRTLRNKKPYMANLYVNGKTQFLGTFYTIDEASNAYNIAATEADRGELQ
jgi:hypothetical protein